MEREKEIARLTRMLRGIARADRFSTWREPAKDLVSFSIAQFNRVLTRMKDLDPAAATLFAPLPETATMEMTRMAAHDLAGYFSDEEPEREGRRHHFGRQAHRGHHGRGCGVRVAVGAMPLGRGWC